jgi:hypothetical protein
MIFTNDRIRSIKVFLWYSPMLELRVLFLVQYLPTLELEVLSYYRTCEPYQGSSMDFP